MDIMQDWNAIMNLLSSMDISQFSKLHCWLVWMYHRGGKEAQKLFRWPVYFWYLVEDSFCCLEILQWHAEQQKCIWYVRMSHIQISTVWFFFPFVPRAELSVDLTSRKASRSSFTPIMSAVSASILGPIRSTKSSKSTFPPAVDTERSFQNMNNHSHHQGFF